MVWGRDSAKSHRMIDELYQNPVIKKWGIQIKASNDLDSLVAQSDLIITTTSARDPIVKAELVQKGTHITAMGSDDHGKQELASELLSKTDRVIADSVSQCVDHGECAAGIRVKQIDESSIIELGNVIKNPQLGRTQANQITVADLTGVAIQDIQVAKMIAGQYKTKNVTGN